MTLVAGWRTWYRQWSTWLAAIGAATLSFTPEMAEALNYVWINLPLDIKSSFPEEWIRLFGIALTLLSIPAKLIRQRRLYEIAERDKRTVG
ncbi:hypothetical protein PAEH1_01570 [Paenalcaligenes hominis]|uniref:Uncharacterized protein n=1 Tax=Paenalcaligenes hominis TaxID=643674 RepID=A0A1U9JXS0_9BURK|nr:hypothetical protein [Paenalcaligenes hominis]AQS50568.1 hypothetical protein PAEH1_01570 [Paenalcaligenes hominis]